MLLLNYNQDLCLHKNKTLTLRESGQVKTNAVEKKKKRESKFNLTCNDNHAPWLVSAGVKDGR